jgi:PAS domain S-box-containing protein
MRLRVIVLVLAILAFLSVSTGGGLYYFSLRKTVFSQAEDHAETRLELLQLQLTTFLSEHIRPVKILAGLKELRMVLEKEDMVYQVNVDSILDNFMKSLNVEVCYLMDAGGMTIASSNRNDYDSFVGKNFSFRPYFRKAIKGTAAVYLAQGTTSKKRGIYYTHPVYGRHGRVVLGVAVIKASVERIESKLFAGSEGVLLVADANGVIFIANKREMRFMLLWELSRERIRAINASRQFGDGPWLWTGFERKNDLHVMDRSKARFLYSDMELDGFPGWKIVHLMSWENIGKQLADPFIRVTGPVIVVVLIFTGIAVFILYNMASKEIVRRKKAEKELRYSEERYRHIYNHTPVMLHSIDTRGLIIRVSDYWLDKMGYERHEVIEKPLTGFYTEQSRKIAEEVIFPVFFKTGFCKDVPYTYVKKDGGHIEILLSCFGVRDDDGKVVRSLAVSVDVTEKNQVQKDLEQAKEKLARHSQDLEHQVETRTLELKRVRDTLRQLSGKIMAAHENERRKVARELHDHLGQILTALKMDTVWLEKNLMASNENAALRARRTSSLIDDTIEDVRRMAFQLRPGVLDDLGLVAALEILSRDFEDRSDISCIFYHDNVPEVDDTLATAFYRIAQEAMTNAVRHAGATSIKVELTLTHGALVLCVTDNGCGFSPGDQNGSAGLGLTGMKERATLVGGDLRIDSEPHGGTRVCCHVKIDKDAQLS